MITLKKMLLKFAGKGNFQLDDRISFFYLVRICWKYGWMFIRGVLTSFGYSEISSSIFVGKHVQFIQKNKLSVGRKTKIHDKVKIDALSVDGVILGSNVVVGRNTCIECTGSLDYVGKGVVIGNNTSFGNDCFFGAAGGVFVGDDVIAGQYVRFHSENHNYANSDLLIREQGVSHKGIKVGNNCWIGAGAVFLDGSSIGNGCVVAANSVVTKSFPDNSVIAGIPAKIIKMR